MKRLIIATTASGGGCLKASGIANKVFGLHWNLGWGPAPFTDDPLSFFTERKRFLMDDSEHLNFRINQSAHKTLKSIMVYAFRVEAVELWVDRDPNSQFLMLQVLDLLGRQPGIENKLRLVHLDGRLGEQRPENVASWKLKTPPIKPAALELGAICWNAFRNDTPELWFQLLSRQDIHHFPHLRSSILRFLQELPAIKSSLSKTQHQILLAISQGQNTPGALLNGLAMEREEAVLDYWHFGWLLDEFSTSRIPAISGLNEGPFTIGLHDDRGKIEVYRNSLLSLTKFGEGLLAGTNDLSEHNIIDRWWGGTHLTKDALWRWDDAQEILVSP